MWWRPGLKEGYEALPRWEMCTQHDPSNIIIGHYLVQSFNINTAGHIVTSIILYVIKGVVSSAPNSKTFKV